RPPRDAEGRRGRARVRAGRRGGGDRPRRRTARSAKSRMSDLGRSLYLRPGDLAKIVYLFVRDGAWAGKVLVDPEWVKASLAPSVTVVEGKVKYGFKWWLYAYGDDGKRWAWGGSGFGGQMPIVLPEFDLLMVFTGWNVRPDRPRLG